MSSQTVEQEQQQLVVEGLPGEQLDRQGDSGSVTIALVVNGSAVDTATSSAAYGIASVINH